MQEPAIGMPLSGLSTGVSGNKPRTLLITMPFYSALRPSLQICGLAALASSKGFDVDTLHLSLDLAARVGVPLYRELGWFRGYEIGNWLFAPSAFPDDGPDPEGRLPDDLPEAIEHLSELGGTPARLRELREKVVPEYLEEAARSVDWSRYSLVGFSSTFQQNNASLALARLIKLKYPDVVTLFGGANFEGEMGAELVRTCPQIDMAVDGEGEAPFLGILAAMAGGEDPYQIAGVVSRSGRGGGGSRPFTDLSGTVAPDYHEYFERAARLGIVLATERHTVQVPFEGSRGCWWGQKHHCTFCGLNGQSMAFRQKPAAQVLDELASMSRRWGVFQFAAVDNIMAPDFWKDFIPRLAEQGRSYELFFEIKSNLTRPQVKALVDAGVSDIQPGIESLSTHVLKLMRKGVRGIQNVNLLRWARHHGLNVDWNLLYGFPGERIEDYEAQTQLLAWLTHLQPPSGAGRIWMERFSPIFKDRANFPARYVRPLDGLRYVYPERIDLSCVAYFFDYEFEAHLPDETYQPFAAAAGAWREAWEAAQKPHLSYRWSPGVLHITDARVPANAKRYEFPGPLADVYHVISERPISIAAAAASVGLADDAAEIGEALDLMAANGLVMREDDLVLALALPARQSSVK